MERQTLFAIAVADQAFDFHAVNDKRDDLMQLYDWKIPLTPPPLKYMN